MSQGQQCVCVWAGWPPGTVHCARFAAGLLWPSAVIVLPSWPALLLGSLVLSHDANANCSCPCVHLPSCPQV